MRIFLIPLTILALGACDRTPDDAAPQPAEAASSNSAADTASLNVAEQVAALPQNLQEGVFFRAIRDAGLPCQDIIMAERTEPTRGMATWRAQCEDKAYHLIIVKPDGTAQVVSRTTP